MSDSAGEPSAPSRLVRLPETDSTNAEAMRRALAGEAPPLWVLADRQTAGRGRAGRAWASQPGNLFASLLVSTSCPPALAGQLSLVAGVAAIDAIRRAAGQRPPAGLRLKLPLTHRLLGQLVGAERPSISNALGRLARAGLVTGSPGDWHLHGTLDGQLEALIEHTALPEPEPARPALRRRWASGV